MRRVVGLLLALQTCLPAAGARERVFSALVLCVPPRTPLPPWLLMGAHLALIAVQVVGGLWIKKLSPNWPR